MLQESALAASAAGKKVNFMLFVWVGCSNTAASGFGVFATYLFINS
jgi:hypothetical protein